MEFWKLFKYAVDGIIDFSEVPLRCLSLVGFGFSIFSFLMLLVIIFRKLIFGDPVAGWASTVCVIIFIEGVQLLSIGMMGQYISKIYSEVKNRRHYIIDEKSFVASNPIR